MLVKVRIFGTLRLDLKKDQMDIELTGEQATVSELLALLSERLGEIFYERLFQDEKTRRGVIILVNGQNIYHLEGLETKIGNEDVISIFPPGAGG